MTNELRIIVTEDGMKVTFWISGGVLTEETLGHIKAVIAEAQPKVERRKA